MFGGSLFKEICYLIDTKLDVQSLIIYILQSFCNEITNGDHNALHFLRQYLGSSVIHNTTMIGNINGML
jgi:hypothetical protein